MKDKGWEDEGEKIREGRGVPEEDTQVQPRQERKRPALSPLPPSALRTSVRW